jgi:hypothetical protein
MTTTTAKTRITGSLIDWLIRNWKDDWKLSRAICRINFKQCPTLGDRLPHHGWQILRVLNCFFFYRPCSVASNGIIRTISISYFKHCSPTTHLRRRRGERRYSSYSFTTSALDGSKRSASSPGRALPRGKYPCTHRTGGWVGPTAGMVTEARGKILSPLPGIEPRPVRSQTLYWLSYPAHTVVGSSDIKVKPSNKQQDTNNVKKKHNAPLKCWPRYLRITGCIIHVSIASAGWDGKMSDE